MHMCTFYVVLSLMCFVVVAVLHSLPGSYKLHNTAGSCSIEIIIVQQPELLLL